MRTSEAGVPASRSRAISRLATIAVMALGLTGSPRSSMTKQRSASPSKAIPMSAPCSRTAACRSRRFSGSSGFASWLGKVPSSSKYRSTISSGSSGSPDRGAEDGGDGVAAHAVAGVDDHLQRPHLREVDERAQEGCVVAEDVTLGHGAGLGLLAGEAVAAVEDGLAEVADLRQAGVLADGAGAGTAQLDPVVLRRVVAGGEHRAGQVEAPLA